MALMRHTSAALPSLFALAVLLVAASAPAAPYANPGLLVETGELAGLVGAADVRIVDLRGDPDRGEAAYRAGHLPGAVYLPGRGLDDEQANARGLPIRPDAAAAIFGRLGIDHD